MKHTVNLLCLAMLCSNHLWAQSIMAPHPPAYAIVNTPGATLARIVDTMYAHANPYDTVEGGALDQIATFQALWQGRVSANDSSGVNMFQQYYYALKTAAASSLASPCTDGGNWSQTGPGALPQQVSGFTNAIWVDPADTNYMLAGTVYGGLFKSADGGAHWSNQSDAMPIAGGMMGVTNYCSQSGKSQHHLSRHLRRWHHRVV